ncbi:MAG TPA: hypothetical protein VF498_10110 [Anaerolineales bacterium]
MDSKIVQSVCQEVYRRFPELAGVQPKVQAQASAQAKSPAASANYLLTFQGHATAADRQVMSRSVRVVVSDKGKILKISTSR